MHGDDVRRAREAAKLSRARLAERAGLTPGAVYRIEHKNTWKPGEEERLRHALRELLGEVVVTGTAGRDAVTPRPEPAWDEAVTLTEWNGLRAGDEVVVEGESRRARFSFQLYYRSPTQEYVQVRGGIPGHSLTRCFRPERVRAAHR